MDLYTLDENFQPVDLFESYESLIWTERYDINGDFQLVSKNVQEAVKALKLDSEDDPSYVGIRDSLVPMMVEVHKIEEKDGVDQITITGRSFEAPALERRVSVKDLPSAAGRPSWTINANKESDAAYLAIRTVIGDVARGALSSISPAVSPYDAIPEIDLTLPADFDYGTLNTYDIAAASLYKTVTELLKVNHRGIKSVRPGISGTQVSVEIYNGANLSEHVVFNVRLGDFVGKSYLLSNQPNQNVAYTYGPNGSQRVLKTSAPEPSGLARRVLLVDGTGDASFGSANSRTNLGLIALYQTNAVSAFDGSVVETIGKKYNLDPMDGGYALGDIIKLVGDYGLSTLYRVTEFIRSSDNTGTKAYPTLEAVSEEARSTLFGLSQYVPTDLDDLHTMFGSSSTLQDIADTDISY